MSLERYLREHPKKHLIFDFDETLFTLQLPWEIYIKEMTAKLLEFDPSLATYTHAKALNDLENEAVRRHGTAAQELRIAYSTFFETSYLAGVNQHYELTTFLAENSSQYSCFLWTSNVRVTVQPILEKHGLLRCFKKLVTKSDVFLTKPEPEGFYTIFDALTQKKEEYLMIGDSQNDKHAAEHAGIAFFSVKQPLTVT